MDPEVVAKSINELVVERSNFRDNELVSQYEVTPDLIKHAQENFDKDVAISEFWRNKYQNELVRNWDLFYKRNETNFFKDRMWLQKEFTELAESGLSNLMTDTKDNDTSNDGDLIGYLQEKIEKTSDILPLLVEIGCGVGNAIIPILFRNPSLRAIGVDCSKRAIDFLNKRWDAIQNENGRILQPRKPTRSPCNSTSSTREEQLLMDHHSSSPWCGGQLIKSGVWDITKGCLPSSLCDAGTADFVLLLFVLSAIPRKYFIDVVKRAAEILKPGGFLFFRDYGRYDMTQIRFAKSQRSLIEENCYVRQDGTLAYFFSIEEIHQLFVQDAQLKMIENRQFTNRKTQQKMKRIWIQSKFYKP